MPKYEVYLEVRDRIIKTVEASSAEEAEDMVWEEVLYQEHWYDVDRVYSEAREVTHA